jgi:hypothetical protein
MRKLAAVEVLDITGREPADVAEQAVELWLRTPARTGT